MSELLDFHKKRKKKSLEESKIAAIAGLKDAADVLLRAIPEVESGSITREVDELVLEVVEALVPLRQFFIDELNPEHYE